MHSLARTAALVASGLLLAAPAWAADPIHVRGIVSVVDGSKVTVHTREGKDVALTLGDSWKFAGVEKAAMTDIKAGSFIGTANQEGAGGAKALEVVVFPEAMRGTGEGDYGWDLKPKSSMTNATVSNPVTGVDGQTVTLTYKGSQKKVTIAPDTPIVTIGPATAADVKPGVAVFIASAPTALATFRDRGSWRSARTASLPRCDTHRALGEAGLLARPAFRCKLHSMVSRTQRQFIVDPFKLLIAALPHPAT